MAKYKCKQCGFEKESRCRVKNCPECKAKDAMEKVE